MAGAGEVVQGTQYDAATMMKYTKPIILKTHGKPGWQTSWYFECKCE